MGRANRKGARSTSRTDGSCGHWTETHPDRHLWSPGRLAVARTQTQEEYEALYGRGEINLESSERSEPDIKKLSDEEILAILAEAPPLHLHEGASLYHSEKDEYQTVALRIYEGEYQGFAVYRDQYTRHGHREKLVASGSSIGLVAETLNLYILDQRERLGYRSRSYPDSTTGKVSPSQARLVAEKEALKLNIAKEEEKG